MAEELHKLFKYTKEIFGVDILIIPIDDVDMNLKQGYQIADSIRKYMSSPYIIPIVAFNIRQMRVVTKHNKYKQFGLKIDDKVEDEELSFLCSLPNDYLSKVFPPNRRIYLKSVFEILKEANEIQKKEKENKKEEDNIIFKMNDIELSSFNMISLISEFVYEYYYGEDSFSDVSSSVFLSNRSMRNFLNDCYCVLSSLNSLKLNPKTNKEEYQIDRQVIKDRFAPDDINAFVTKEHALTWLWNEYIDVAKNSLQNINSVHKNYNWARVVTETLPEDSSAEIINKKSYARVWLQQYYRKYAGERVIKEEIEDKDKLINNKYIFQKTCNIAGALELAMRSYIPMYLFEGIVKNHNLEYQNCDLTSLQNFASKPLLNIAYELSMMEINLFKGDSANFTPKPIGSLVMHKDLNCSDDKASSITDMEFNIPFLFKVINQEKISESGHHQIHIISIFKSIALFIELSQICLDNSESEKKKIKALIERYRVNMPGLEDAPEMSNEYIKKYINKIKSEHYKYLNIDFQKSSFGILEIARFSKRLANYFINVRDNIEDTTLYDFKNNLEKEEMGSRCYYPLITYFTSFGQSLFISLFNSIKTDELLSIKNFWNKRGYNNLY